jgi:muramoyltetrapeptide carboxypeptidase
VTAPRALRAGDRVAVVAPAGPIPADLLAEGVAVLRGWGLEVSVGAHVTDRHLGYLAGTDADRAADLQQAWCDPQVAAVVCARGGYGCLRLLPHLDWAALAGVAPKPLVGSSDVTVLHHAFAAALGVPTVFGPMPASGWFTGDAATRDALRRCLFDPGTPTVVTGPGAGPLAAGTGGVARGVSAGGTVSLLAALAGAAGPVGTPPPEGCVLLLEDVTESPYRLDRIITQLVLAGWLDRVAGIALGSWTDCGPLPEVRAVLADRLAGLGVPVAWGLTFGHCAAQATIRLGMPAVLDADAGRLAVN